MRLVAITAYGKTRNVKAVAEELKCSLFKDGLKGYHVWSERYDRKMKDILALQDEIVLESRRDLFWEGCPESLFS